jgi:DNA-binding PadR family transcriptional regulator
LNIFKKAGKMSRSYKQKDMKILKALLIPQKSLYELEKNLKGKLIDSNYATVYRHIQKMKKEGLVRTYKTPRKNGKQDERETQKPDLTLKGIATVLIEGDLEKEELESAVRRVLQNEFNSLPLAFLTLTKIDGMVANMLLRMRPKVNLKYFDEEYFIDVLVDSFRSSLDEAIDQVEASARDRAELKALMNKTLDGLKKIGKRKGFNQDIEDVLKFSTTLEERLKERLLLKRSKKGD